LKKAEDRRERFPAPISGKTVLISSAKLCGIQAIEREEKGALRA
jgi:hypothetical protein